MHIVRRTGRMCFFSNRKLYIELFFNFFIICFFYFCSYCPAPESMRFMSLTSSLKRSDSEEQSVHITVNKCWQHLEIIASLMIHPPRIPRGPKCQGCQTLL